jgi:hypothetical protein
MLTFALALTAAAPTPLTDIHQRDISCVAVIGIIAFEQRSGKDALKTYPDVRDSGKRWGGLVGDRVTFETGQTREVVGFAIQQAVQAEQAEAGKATDPAAQVKSRFTECKAIMDAQLAAEARSDEPLGATEKSAPALAEPDWNTDNPEKIALYRQQLGEDLKNPSRIRFCDGMIAATHLEIGGREGFDSRDALAFGRLERALEQKVMGLPKSEGEEKANLEKMFGGLKTEADKEEVVARCIRLGESLALAMPPE